MPRRLEALAHVALLLAALLACGKGSKSSASSTARTAGTGDPPVTAEEAIDVSAPALIADYKTNAVRGDVKWKGKLVRVTGVVGDITKATIRVPFGNDVNSAMVTIESGDPQYSLYCYLAKEHEKTAASLSKGEPAAFKGRVDALRFAPAALGTYDLDVKECEVVPSPPTVPVSQPQPSTSRKK